MLRQVGLGRLALRGACEHGWSPLSRSPQVPVQRPFSLYTSSARGCREERPHTRHGNEVSLNKRRLNSSSKLDSETSPSAATLSSPSTSSSESILATYNGPLSKTFFRLKLFSLGSLALATALCPALLLAPGTIGTMGRVGLCCTALATSGASTSLIAWIGKPYAAEMRLLSAPASQEQLAKDLAEDISSTSTTTTTTTPAIQVFTTSWRLQKLQTTIYEPNLIRPTSRPFATWELPVAPPRLALDIVGTDVQSVTKLVASTRSVKEDKVVGRWWATWTRDALTKEGSEWKSDGRCREEGKVVRHFSIHEELLDEDWQVL